MGLFNNLRSIINRPSFSELEVINQHQEKELTEYANKIAGQAVLLDEQEALISSYYDVFTEQEETIKSLEEGSNDLYAAIHDLSSANDALTKDLDTLTSQLIGRNREYEALEACYTGALETVEELYQTVRELREANKELDRENQIQARLLQDSNARLDKVYRDLQAILGRDALKVA